MNPRIGTKFYYYTDMTVEYTVVFIGFRPGHSRMLGPLVLSRGSDGYEDEMELVLWEEWLRDGEIILSNSLHIANAVRF